MSQMAGTSTCPRGPDELKGTGFGIEAPHCGGLTTTSGGATGWLTTHAEVVPGSTLMLEFMIWDTGDHQLDSSVLLDNFRWIADEVIPGTERPVVK